MNTIARPIAVGGVRWDRDRLPLSAEGVAADGRPPTARIDAPLRRRKTNGKAERFIQALLREWAYRRPYLTSSPGPAHLVATCATTTISAPIRAWAVHYPGSGSRGRLMNSLLTFTTSARPRTRHGNTVNAAHSAPSGTVSDGKSQSIRSCSESGHRGCRPKRFRAGARSTA